MNIEFDSEQLLKQLGEIEAGLQQKAIRSGLVKAAAPIKKAVKEKIAAEQLIDKGHMLKAIGHLSISKRAKVRLGVPQQTVAIIIGPNRKIIDDGKKRWQGRKAIWHEFGTKRMKATPFLESSKQQSEGQMGQLFFQGLQAYINKIGATNG